MFVNKKLSFLHLYVEVSLIEIQDDPPAPDNISHTVAELPAPPYKPAPPPPPNTPLPPWPSDPE